MEVAKKGRVSLLLSFGCLFFFFFAYFLHGGVAALLLKYSFPIPSFHVIMISCYLMMLSNPAHF